MSPSSADLHGMRTQRVVHLIARSCDDLRWMRPEDSAAIVPGIDARHLEDVLKQPRQALDFRKNHVALFQPILRRQLRSLEIARRDADGRQRRAEVVAERRKQGGFQLFALTGELRALAFLQKLRPFDRNRHDAAKRVERARLDRPA